MQIKKQIRLLQYLDNGILISTFAVMKRFQSLILIVAFTLLSQTNVLAQCSICTKTAQQLGEKPALGLNNGILYLIFTPFLLIGVIGYRWWKGNKDAQ